MSKPEDPSPSLISVQEVQPDRFLGQTAKKQFVEPKVLAPLDVLEATTSFLFVTADTSAIP